MAKIRPHERTTPAGRFASEPGRNTGGEDIVWVDYETQTRIPKDSALWYRKVIAENAVDASDPVTTGDPERVPQTPPVPAMAAVTGTSTSSSAGNGI